MPRRLFAALAVVLLIPSMALAATFAPPPSNALDILWADYCGRTSDARCLTPTPSPTSSSATPSTTPTSPPTATPAPTSTAAPTSTPTSTATPAPTATPTLRTIGAKPASGTGPLVCPSGYVNWESRGWWTPSGQPFDQYRGIDAEICWPANGFLKPGTTVFLLHIQERRLHAPIKLVRIGLGPDGNVNAFEQSVNLVPDAAGYGEWYLSAPTKANSKAGWNEYRLTANVPSDEDGNRQYQSTGLQAWTTANSPHYRNDPWWETRGWYVDTDYVNNRMYAIPPTAPVHGTYSFPWQCTATGTGTVSYHAAYVDANTHAIPMVLPHVYNAGSGAFNGTISIDTTAFPNGVHKVLTRCDLTVSQGTTSALTQFLITVSN